MKIETDKKSRKFLKNSRDVSSFSSFLLFFMKICVLYGFLNKFNASIY